MRTRAPLLALLLAAACPEQVGQQCPARTVPLGQYAIYFAGQHPANECTAPSADGGPEPLVAEDGGTRFGALCYGSPDGGPQIYLVIPGKGARSSPLLADGGFHFTGNSPPVGGTACVCPVAIDETFDGFLQTTPAGPIAVQADGGLPPVTGLVGALTDTLSTDAGTTGCLCTLPCPVTYGITGTRQ